MEQPTTTTTTTSAASTASEASIDSEVSPDLLDNVPRIQAFASPEHQGIGREGIMKSRFGKEFATQPIFSKANSTNPRARFTFGHVVAAAGDFYGPLARVDKISRDANGKERTPDERREKARKAVASMLKAEPRQIESVVNLFDECQNKLEDFRKRFPNLPESEFYERVWTAKHELDRIIFHKVLSSKDYGDLLMYNHDHFLPEARTTYLTLHEIAVEYGEMAKKERDEEKKKELINLALVYEGWSGHYLTDSFSSGHIRTPREKFDKGNFFLSPAFANAMHNEDGKGLVVSHTFDKEYKEQWIAVGDGKINNEDGKIAREKVLFTVTTSLNHLYSVIYDDKPIENEAPSLIPVAVPEEHVRDRDRVYYPLLCVDEKNEIRTRMKAKGSSWEWVERTVKKEMERVGRGPALILFFVSIGLIPSPFS